MHECFSIAFTKRWEKLTFINAKVSDLIHNHRTIMASKYYKIGSSAQPVDDLNKFLHWVIYTQTSLQLLEVSTDLAVLSKDFHLCKFSVGLLVNIPRAVSFDPSDRASMPSIYGVTRGFNHRPVFINWYLLNIETRPDNQEAITWHDLIWCWMSIWIRGHGLIYICDWDGIAIVVLPLKFYPPTNFRIH